MRRINGLKKDGSFYAVDGIIFDFDGTLVHSGIDFGSMKEKIVDCIKRYCVYHQGIENGLYVLELVHAAQDALKGEPYKMNAFTRDAYSIIGKIEEEASENAFPIPGAVESLFQLSREGYRIGVITRNGRKSVNSVLSRYGFPCDVVLTRDDVREIKPHPKHLLCALQQLDVDVSRGMMVGDHPIDIACGRAAGVLTVGVLSARSTEQELALAKADFIVHDVTHIPRLIDNLSRRK